MKKTTKIIIALALIFIAGCTTVETAVKDFGNSTKILDFEADSPEVINLNGAETRLINGEYGKALEINFLQDENYPYPGVYFTFDESMDWTNHTLEFDLYNNSDEVVTFNMRVDSLGVDNAGGVEGAYSYTISAPAQSYTPVTLIFADDGRDYGMRGLPGSINKKLWGENLVISEIFQFIIYQVSPEKESTISVDNFRITPSEGGGVNVEGIIDEFGQNSRNDYQGKIHSLEELLNQAQEETAELASVIPGELEGRSRFGGWLNEEKRLSPADFFRAEKVGDKWWLVDPDGYLFFSTGLDIVRTGDGYTLISDREDMFQNIPAKDGPLGDHWDYSNYLFKGPVSEGDIFNFYTANLERKYGEDWESEWKDSVLKRTAAWGFTSFGNWSDPELFWGKGDENKIAYFGHGNIEGTHRTLASGPNYWGPVSDPFDPEFQVDTQIMADELYSMIGDDPWCVGVFVDNEISWGNNQSDQMYYGLIYSAMAEDMDSPAKSACLSLLKEKYEENITDLNQLWNTDFTSWNDLESPFDVAGNITEGMKTDLSFLMSRYAEQYYRVIKEALQAAGVKQMYLGSRLADWGSPDEVVRAAAEYCDVVSFNWYKTGVDRREFQLIDELDVPIIIGEFHFGAIDRGQFMPGIVAASNQAQRGKMYRDYIQSVLDNPFFVGAHWFQLYDQPVSGRAWDGENYNTGFVSVTDIPYEPLVNAARNINNQVYTIRDASTIYYNTDLVRSDFTIQSFDGFDESAVSTAYKGARMKPVSEGTTDNTTAMEINVGTLDSDYAGVVFTPSPELGRTWNWGSNCLFKVDAVNPNRADIQIRLNITDVKGSLRTFYFNMEGGESRTLIIPYESLGPHGDKWDIPDGFWGANSGLDTEQIKSLDFYIWEDNDFGSSAGKFIIDNMRVENS